ncbi:aspartate/glutamate racemase family protein [Ancylobacter mangrovi]|uniref:aspartate/glutamate racemase family protein n=1 Tax=Ancylobacter mangrovi TaxID=2972472 RepID=UPI002161EB58|nr:aspartate/glutamate racemase family protein [Ancylobacter mangrovi]MCS0500795.1 aspartate/glutamate racemase family protein [Ancylobacter mangrovi]
MTSPRIVLLHATPVAIDPVLAAFAQGWPEAELVNLLDDALSADRAREADLGEEMIERFVTFARYGHRIGADGLLVTCSAFGPAIERAAAVLPVPVLKPNEAMFEAALAQGDRIGMLATFAPSIGTMEDEFAEESARLRPSAALTTVLVPDAIDLLRKGDADTHNRLVAQAAPRLGGMDAVMLAHFSTSRAAPLVRERLEVPVLTAPGAAVAKMKRLVTGAQAAA